MNGVQGHQPKGTTMQQILKTTKAAIVGVATLAMLSTTGFAAQGPTTGAFGASMQLAHMNMGQGQAGQRMGQPCPMGMMGQGMMAPGMGGQGMMGPGQRGQGMMGSGTGRQGMMGPGIGRGLGLGSQVVPSKDLSADDVRHFLEHRLEMHGNKRLKVGEVKAADDDKIVADITTVDDSLVQRLEVDRHTGNMQHVE